MVRVGVDAAAGAEADDALVLLCAPAPEEDEDDDVDAGADLAGGVRAPGRGCCCGLEDLLLLPPPLLPPLLNAKHPIGRRARRPLQRGLASENLVEEGEVAGASL
jgi:hypothetical protein